MAGEISNLYGYNPYSMMNPYGSTMNNDFMAQQYFAQGTNPAQGMQIYQQPSADTYQKGSGLPAGLALGTAAGAGTGAITYFYGTTPVKDGKINNDLLKIFGEEKLKNLKIEKAAELIDANYQPIFNIIGVKNGKEYDAIQKLAQVAKVEDLPEDIRKQLPADIKTPAEAKAAIDLAKPELEKIKPEKIAKQAYYTINNQYSASYNQAQLNRLNAIKTKIEAIKKDATKADLEKFFTDNKEIFGLKGTDAEISAKSKRLADKIGTREQLLANYQAKIDARTARINAININLESQFKTYLDETGKTLKSNAPEAVQKAFKNFKWQKAGKFGTVVAGAGLLLGWMFGGE